MASILISGPAGAAKSAMARRLYEEAVELTAIADFQSIYAAITGDTRGPDGRYPLRDNRLLPLVEYTRRSLIHGAVNRQIDVLATNSDGSSARRNFLLEQLGAGATERIVDPGRDVVSARLMDDETEELDPECDRAIGRWYGRLT